MTDGPFLETKEYLGGFWIIEAADLDAALALGHRGLEGVRRQGRGAPLPGRACVTAPGRRRIAQAAIERIYREEYGRVVASLARRFGDLDIAEDAAGEALLVALERWPVDGIPPNPGGWLTTTAAQPRHRPDPPRAAPRRQAPGGRHDRATTPPTSRPASSRTTGSG